MKNASQYIRGFTLIETLVAITILMLLIVGPLSSLSKSIADTQYVLHSATASYLAEEGMETIRAYLITGNDYSTIATTCASNCGVEENATTIATISSCSNLNSCVLKWDGSLYSHSSRGGVNTLFTRTISATTALVDEIDLRISTKVYETVVTITVSWSEDGVAKSVSMKDYYYNTPYAVLPS